MVQILVIDDEEPIRKLLARIIELEGYKVSTASCCSDALQQLRKQQYDVILCDVFLPDGNGVDFIFEIKKYSSDAAIILLTAHGNIEDGVQAIKNGAFDYITKGDDNRKIIPTINRAVDETEKKKGKKTTSIAYSFDSIVGKSKELKQAITLAQKVSKTDAAVLLTGETGTGKEVFAHAIHQASERAALPIVDINCSAFSKDLLESELFGYKAGAFTGALKDKKGLFEVANHGTIFLDEIGELSMLLQAKLLRVLQEGKIRRIGSNKEEEVNVRIIGATHKNLEEMIKNGEFREDLYYRLNVIPIKIPSLKERLEDIPMLVHYFINKLNKKIGTSIKGYRQDFLDELMNYEWPGNVRELQNIVERAMNLCSTDILTSNEISIKSTYNNENNIENIIEYTSEEVISLKEEIEKYEKQVIMKVYNTNKSYRETAKKLGISHTAVMNKIKKYNITM